MQKLDLNLEEIKTKYQKSKGDLQKSIIVMQ